MSSKWEIYILKWVKNHHYICFHITRNESSKPRPTGKTFYFQFGQVEKLYAEWRKAGKFLNLSYKNWQNITKIIF